MFEEMGTRQLLRELASTESRLLKLEAKKEKLRLEWLAIALAGVIALLVGASLGIGAALGGRTWAGALIVGALLLASAGVAAKARHA